MGDVFGAFTQWLGAAIAPATWASWAAAGATFCAAWFAMKLARTAQRDQRNQEKIRAELTAARFAPLIERDAQTLRAACMDFELHPTEATVLLDREMILVHSLRRMHFSIQSDDLAALVPLGEQCATRIARAYSLLSIPMADMEGFSQIRHLLKDEWHEAMAEAEDLLTRAAATCAKHGQVERFDTVDVK